MEEGAVTVRMIMHAVVAGAAIALVFVLSPRSFAGDTDTARNYLSTIVSCLSTIFTLCISITLVAIQLTASRYTHRVLDLFLKMPFNISLTLVYFVTIIQSLYLLSRITEPIHETLPAYLQPQMNADMVLVIICFGMLVLYMRAVMQLLKPERIVAEIKGEFYRSLRRRRVAEALEKVEQVCDIAKRAAADMDSTTGMIAVRALYSMSERGTRRVRGSAVTQFVEIAAVAAKEREGGMLGAVLESAHALCEDAVLRRSWKAGREAVNALERITRGSLVGQQLFPSVEYAVETLFNLAELALAEQVKDEENRGDAPHAVQFAEHACQAVLRIGREILLREADGEMYVGRAVLGRRYEALLVALSGYEDGQQGREAAAARMVVGASRLCGALMEKGRVRHTAPVVAWLGRAVQSEQPRLRAWALAMSALVCALAGFLDRPDIRELLLATVALSADWPGEALSRLPVDYEDVWAIYDYADLDALFRECRRAWEEHAKPEAGLRAVRSGAQRWRALVT